MKQPKYIYENIKVVRVIDGDTVELEVNVGFGFAFRDIFRLNRINCPEIRGKQKEEGLVAKRYVFERLFGERLFGITRKFKGKVIVNGTTIKFIPPIKIQTFKKGKFGRWIVEIWVDGKNLSDELVSKKLAWYHSY